MPPNFVLLDASLPDVAGLLIAMVQARGYEIRRTRVMKCPAVKSLLKALIRHPGASSECPLSE
jgi:hypothetical protein